jgi:hypothetical protein
MKLAMNSASLEMGRVGKSISGPPLTHLPFLIARLPLGMPERDSAMLVFMARESEAPDTPCGCTNCYRLFSFADISEFWDNGEIPVCPCCGSDNVVISTPDMVVDVHCLFAMRKTYH